MRPTKIGERVEIDVFGLWTTGELQQKGIASGTIIALAPGTITVRLDGRTSEVTVGPSRVLPIRAA
jgi:hypothetical protein